jgi:hypothetical protein
VPLEGLEAPTCSVVGLAMPQESPVAQDGPSGCDDLLRGASCAALPGRATLEGRFEQFETNYPLFGRPINSVHSNEVERDAANERPILTVSDVVHPPPSTVNVCAVIQPD